MVCNPRNIFDANVPETPQNSAIYQGDMAPERMSTAGGLDTDLSRGRGDPARFTAACAAATGEMAGGSAGFGLSGDVDDDFSSKTYNGSQTGSDRSGYGEGIAGEAPMSSSTYNGSDMGSDRSGYGKVL